MAPDNGEQKTEGKAEKASEERYSTEDLLANARALTGAPRRVLAGALATESRETHTPSQAKKAVSSFLGRPVEVDDPNEEDEE